MIKLTDTAETVLKRRYYLEGEDWDKLCTRVAQAVAIMERTPDEQWAYAAKFHEMIYNLDFLPNSPCLMNAGTELGQLSACFVLPIEDTLSGIFDAVKNGALVNKTGGGTGYSFSRLRPKDSSVCSTNGVASGPISFAKVFDTATDVIKQGGRRRGANMGVLRVDHPDILEFIDCKRDKTVLTNFNLSVALTDDFMKRVLMNDEYALIDPSTKKEVGKLKAGDVFDKIIDAAWDNGEPGVLFIDAANRANTCKHLGDFEATNPSLIEGTKVWTTEGIKPIEQLDGVDFFVRNLWGGESPATCWKSGVNKELFTLTLQGGHKHHATPEHKWPVILKDGSIVKKRSDQLAIGDLIVKGGFEFSISKCSDYTRAEGFVTGWNIGDGWRTELKDGRVQYGFIVTGDKRQNAIIDQLSVVLENLGCDTSLINKEELNLSAVGLRNFFDSIGYTGKENGLPSKVWSGASENFIVGMIDGLFSSDGNIDVKNNRITYTTKDEKIAKDLSELLSFYGIKTSIRKSSSNSSFPNGVDYEKEYTRFDLTINNYLDIVHFHSVFSLSNSLKQQKLNRIVSSLPELKKLLYSDGVRITDIEFGSVSGDVWDISVFDETHCFKISHVITGNCGEQWLLPFEACNLGSINLGRFVAKNTSDHMKPIIDWQRLEEVTRLAVRFLDNVVDANVFPIPEIKKATQHTRKIGLGIMGLHDMLIKLCVPYGSGEGRSIAGDVMGFIKRVAESESAKLAEEKGRCPAFEEIMVDRRNAALTSIQPTGTVSMIADCSSGCEPYFALVNRKNVMDNDSFIMVNSLFEETMKREGLYSKELMEKVAERGTVVGIPEIPDKWQNIFACAQDISVDDHIRMQSALQSNGVDASISKTINMPGSATKEDVKNAYLMGWDLGCKGLTVYRDGCREGQVLTVGTKKEGEGKTQAPATKLELPDVLRARRYKLKDVDGQSIYIVICFTDEEYPVEVFAKFPFDNRIENSERSTMWATVCRLTSLSLRCGIPVEEVIKQLDRSSGSMLDLPSQLSKLLKGFMSKSKHGYNAGECQECGGTIVFQEGCMVCPECGYSKCS